MLILHFFCNTFNSRSNQASTPTFPIVPIVAVLRQKELNKKAAGLRGADFTRVRGEAQ